MLAMVSYRGRLPLVSTQRFVCSALLDEGPIDWKDERRDFKLQLGAIGVMTPDCAIVRVENMQGELRQSRRGMWERRAMRGQRSKKGTSSELILKAG